MCRLTCIDNAAIVRHTLLPSPVLGEIQDRTIVAILPRHGDKYRIIGEVIVVQFGMALDTVQCAFPLDFGVDLSLAEEFGGRVHAVKVDVVVGVAHVRCFVAAEYTSVDVAVACW